MKKYAFIKKYSVIALTVMLAATLLTMPVGAAGLMESLKNLQGMVMEAGGIIFTICAIVVGGLTYVKTHSKAGTIAVILFFVVLIGFTTVPGLLKEWGTEIAGMANG